MKKSVNAIFLGVTFFLISNLSLLFMQNFAQALDKLQLLGVFLLLDLFISGFIAGNHSGKNGLKLGAITGVADYLASCILILLYLVFEFNSPSIPKFELFSALGHFSIYLLIAVLPILLIASIITAIGGLFGEKISNLHRLK